MCSIMEPDGGGGRDRRVRGQKRLPLSGFGVVLPDEVTNKSLLKTKGQRVADGSPSACEGHGRIGTS